MFSGLVKSRARPGSGRVGSCLACAKALSSQGCRFIGAVVRSELAGTGSGSLGCLENRSVTPGLAWVDGVPGFGGSAGSCAWRWPAIRRMARPKALPAIRTDILGATVIWRFLRDNDV